MYLGFLRAANQSGHRQQNDRCIFHTERFQLWPVRRTARACDYKEPKGHTPISENIEQQAVTPISESQTAYLFATGLIGHTPELTAQLAKRMDTVMAAFSEDREMIEAQQKIWNLTAPEQTRHFLPQDKGPFLMRKLLNQLIDEESGATIGN